MQTTMLHPGDPGPPWGHPRSWRKTVLFRTKYALVTSNSQIRKISSKGIFTDSSDWYDFPILLRLVSLKNTATKFLRYLLEIYDRTHFTAFKISDWGSQSYISLTSAAHEWNTVSAPNLLLRYRNRSFIVGSAWRGLKRFVWKKSSAFKQVIKPAAALK